MARIFISYAREDFKLVNELRQRLEGAGFVPWMDKVDLIAGQRWRPAIERAIQQTDFFVICLSNHSVKKRSFVQREIKLAVDLWQEKLEDDVYLIPVLLEPVAPEEIPDKLREVGWVFLYEEDGWDELLRALQVGTAQRGINVTQPSTSKPEIKVAKPQVEHARDRTPAPIPSPQPSTLFPSLLTYDFTTVTLDTRGEAIKRRPGTARYFTEEIGGIDLDMVSVPGGEFAMGTNTSEAALVRKEIERYWKDGGHWADTELPQHEVTIPPFFIGKFQVTQAQWRTVARWPKVNIDLTLNPSSFKGDLLPVEQVSWDDAQEFCARLAKKTGKPYRLPSEAEWEYACRAGTMTPFAFGETITPQIVNYDGNYPYANAKKGEYRKQTLPVGSLGVANAFGLFDMHGNVWEWCEDVWHDSYGGQHGNPPTDGSAWVSGGDSSRQVLRGGSWYVVGNHCRSANRYGNSAGNRSSHVGVRVVVLARTP